MNIKIDGTECRLELAKPSEPILGYRVRGHRKYENWQVSHDLDRLHGYVGNKGPGHGHDKYYRTLTLIQISENNFETRQQ